VPNQQPPPTADQLTVWRITGPDATTLEAIVNGLALIWSRLPVRDTEIDPDILAANFPETRDLARSVRVLVEILVAHATGAGRAPARDAERAEAVRAIDSAVQQARLRISKRRREDALGDAAEIIREVGFEFGDHECALATEQDGTDVIALVQVARPVACVSLLGRLMQRADGYMAADAALALERVASTWYFLRWSSGAWEIDPTDTDFTQMVREHEWSIVSRDTLALDEPIIASLARVDEDGESDVPPRQRALADAYAQSTVGIFDVVSVDGRHMTVRDVRDDRPYVVHEHNEDVELFPGLLILGRLIPIGDDEWLRSPGALMIAPDDEAHVAELAEALTAMSETLPTPIALEGLISTAIYDADVPLETLPAATIEEAQAVFVEATELLAELGLIGDVPPADVPPGDVLQGDVPETMLEQLDSPALGLFGLGVDQPMAEWLAALATQAALDAPRARRGQGEGRKQRARAKQRRKQKRKR
jgi:hypothetical protein